MTDRSESPALQKEGISKTPSRTRGPLTTHPTGVLAAVTRFHTNLRKSRSQNRVASALETLDPADTSDGHYGGDPPVSLYVSDHTAQIHQSRQNSSSDYIHINPNYFPLIQLYSATKRIPHYRINRFQRLFYASPRIGDTDDTER